MTRPSISLTIHARSLPSSRARLARLLSEAARSAARIRGSRIESLSIAIVGDAAMRRLNRDFHASDETTDVLAFPFRQGRVIDAEIVICAPFAKREARARGLSWRTELTLYLVHGVLHLTGEDDATARGARRMRRFERDVLARLALPLPRSHLEELKHADP